MTRYGYARISTDEQTHDPQLLALEREGVREIVLDTVSGGVPAASRPGLSELLAKLQPGDSLVAARLDRLGRTMLDVMGLEAARRSGSRLGRPARLTERQRRHAVELQEAGKSLQEIAQIMAVSKTTIWRAVSCEAERSGNEGSGTGARAVQSV